MRKTEVLILGAGFSGLGAGVEAQSRGRNSLIVEEASAPGGLCRGTTVAGHRFDRYGPKIVIERPSSRDLVQLMGSNSRRQDLREVVYHPDFGLIGFPVQRHLVDLPYEQRELILSELKNIDVRSSDVRSYRDWLLHSYGPYLCEKILFPYEEKKWQISLAEMDYRWALERPVAVDHDEMLEGARRRLPPNRSYFYSREGDLSGLIDSLVERAGPMVLGSTVSEIDPVKRTVTAGGEVYGYEKLISSLPLDTVVRMTPDVGPDIAGAAASLLRWLSVRVYNLVFEREVPLTGGAVYFPEPAVRFRRVAILQNLFPARRVPGRTAVSVEIAGDGNARRIPVEQELPALLKEVRAIPEFSAFGRLLGSDAVDVAHAYPLQRDGLQDLVAHILRTYRRWDIWHCGRAGTFNYCDMDVAYEQGRAAARAALV
jgi:protoporphyrinogen oxidase